MIIKKKRVQIQPRSEGGAEGSVAPSKKFITNTLKNSYEVFITIDI